MMNYLKILICIIVTSTVLCSCSQEEEYTPQVASAIFNSLYVSIFDKQGEAMNGTELLSHDKFSVTEKKSKREAKIEVIDYEGIKMLHFNVNLPDTKDMVYNEDKTEAHGTVELEMNLNGTKLPVFVNFIYSSSKDDTPTFGRNSIRIKSIEYLKNTIYPTEKSGNNFIKIQYDSINTTLEPWR